MFFMIGVVVGVIAGIVRTLMPSLGNWGMAMGLAISGLSIEMAIGFLLAESSIGGLGSIVGGAYSPNLSNPMIADVSIDDKRNIAEEAASLYTVFKVIPCVGFGILILFGGSITGMDVWPWSKLIILLFIIPSVLMKVGSKALLPYIGVIVLSVGGAYILVKTGTPHAIYLFFMSVFTLGGNLAGFRPMPRQRIIKEYKADYPWAFVSGATGSILIGVPSSILLDLSGDKDDSSLYKENAVAAGVSEGMGISLFFIGFGSRDAISSTLALWVDSPGKWQAIACLLLVIGLSIWYYESFIKGLIRVFERGQIVRSSKLPLIGITIGISLLIGNIGTILILSCVGFCIWKILKSYKIEASSLSLSISLVSMTLLG